MSPWKAVCMNLIHNALLIAGTLLLSGCIWGIIHNRRRRRRYVAHEAMFTTATQQLRFDRKQRERS